MNVLTILKDFTFRCNVKRGKAAMVKKIIHLLSHWLSDSYVKIIA